MSGGNKSSFSGNFAAVGCLVILTALVYGQALQFEFVNFDDDVHVYENEHVRSGLSVENVVWAFGIHGPSQWHPLAWVSHQIDCAWFGLDPWGHHLTNIVLHVATVVLLFLALQRLTGDFWPSVIVAALFAVHPLNVESVAWISERRNVLSGVFWMLTLLLYVNYVERGGVRRYGLVVLVFALGLMSKPMLVTLPCVLLLLDIWPLGRWRLKWLNVAEGTVIDLTSSNYPSSSARIIPQRSGYFLFLEKVPLLLLSFLSSVLTVLCQQSEGIVVGLTSLPFEDRLATAVYAYAAYLRKLVWPSDLAVFYPHPSLTGAALPAVWGPVLLLLGLTIAALFPIRRRPFLAVGWFWFLGTLVPMIGLVQVGQQQLADRYTYVAQIGIFVAIAWLIHTSGTGGRTLLRQLGPIVVLAYAGVAFWQTGFWHDSITLFTRTAEVTQRNHWAHNNWGLALYERGQPREAAAHYQQALEYVPAYALAHYNLGVALHDLGQHEQAMACFETAIRLDPRNAAAQARLGSLLAEQGQLDRAVLHFREAFRLQPDHPQMRFNLALVLARQGKLTESLILLREAVQQAPEDYKIRYMLSLVLKDSGLEEEAQHQWQKAMELAPAKQQVAPK